MNEKAGKEMGGNPSIECACERSDLQDRRQTSCHCQIRLYEAQNPLGNKRQKRSAPLKMFSCRKGTGSGSSERSITFKCGCRHWLFNKEQALIRGRRKQPARADQVAFLIGVGHDVNMFRQGAAQGLEQFGVAASASNARLHRREPACHLLGRDTGRFRRGLSSGETATAIYGNFPRGSTHRDRQRQLAAP